MPRKAKTHFLDNTDLSAVIEPPKPAKDFSGTKGATLVLRGRSRKIWMDLGQDRIGFGRVPLFLAGYTLHMIVQVLTDFILDRACTV